MKLLILGGTIFLGRHLIEAALQQGHEVTLFNRGLHGADLYPDVEKLKGNRQSDLTALQGRQWDAVIDTNGYVPSHVRSSAQILAHTTPLYSFISSISVYADLGIVVAQPYRGRGLGSSMLIQLKNYCYEAGWEPICSCIANNYASKKAIEKAGFISEQSMMKMLF